VLAGLAYAVATLVGSPLGEQDFAFIVAGGIVAMLPGRTMAAAIEDVLFGFPLTGAGRLLSVLVALMGLIIGIGAGLKVMLWITTALDTQFVSPTVLELRTDQGALVTALLGALFVGLSAAVTVQSRARLILPTGLLSVGAATIGAILQRSLEFGVITATGFAAIALGAVGRVVAARLRVPSMVIIVPASFALLPGLTIFRGLYELVAVGGASAGSLTIQSGLTTLLSAGAVLLAIATGTVFGEILTSRWDTSVRGERPKGSDGG
jgi:uncharacterized membrane protein YjjB (DUF3815 family)